MESYIGKICPYCKSEIKEGEAVKVCPSCAIPHHESCWVENGGCTTFGCTEQHEEQAAEQSPRSDTLSENVCANCGTLLNDGQNFCPRCGTARAAAPTVPEKRVCTNCGAELQEDQAFCSKCGQKVGLAVDAGVNSAIEQFNANVNKANEKKKKLPLIIGAAVVVLAVILILIFKSPSVDKIVLRPSTLELRTDDSYSVTYTISPDEAKDVEVKWKSSDEDVATVSSKGKITGKGEGTCTITATSGKQSDTIIVTVKDGPDFKALYEKYCQSKWAKYGSDGSYLSIDTNPYDWDDDGLAYPDAYYAIENVNTALGLPESLLNAMAETRGADGKQKETFDDVTVTWSYHPDKGLEVTYKLN